MDERSRTVPEDNDLFLGAISDHPKFVVVRESRNMATRVLSSTPSLGLRLGLQSKSRFLSRHGRDIGSSKSLTATGRLLNLLSSVSGGLSRASPHSGWGEIGASVPRFRLGWRYDSRKSQMYAASTRDLAH
jgi:hypothetical protein